MTISELFLWASHRSYPQLVLSNEPRDVIGAGMASWQYFFEHATAERVQKALARAQQWIEYERAATGA